MKRKLRIKVSRIRRQSVSTPGMFLRTQCVLCAREVEMLTKAQAAVILEVGDSTLEALLSDGRIHALETVGGHQWVCKDSLFLQSQAASRS